MLSIKTLIVEDDKDLAEIIVEYAETENIECDYAFNGIMGFQLAKDNPYDVIITDVNMPGMDGFNLALEIRNAAISTPILMLTARGEVDDKLRGFSSGVDDYLVKPFSMEELFARVSALHRRTASQLSVLKISDLVVDLNQHTATRNGINLNITPTGWLILVHLIRNSPNVVSRSDLEEVAWQTQEPSESVYKTAIYRLRKAIDDGFNKPLLHTVRGVGVVMRDGDV